ncbi:hypothetical protein H6F47_09400 [Sphaerospermopsis sp. FACHB-1094]|uniref:hypothetical protein n=1 Tax=Sphaerospermopsis sp. FACHB-1094 TaxID=2692861 RepID=UPI001681E2D3|nr:hypothetical protein [Sphaerospermopsis sp. FACHB-1094]MBD2132635.1 hypothetical protein [Sphaerospermopsis sp. FACHB-1094]
MNISKQIIVFLVTTILANQIQFNETFARESSKDSVKPSKKDAISIMQGICGKNNINKYNPEACETCPSFTGSDSFGGVVLTSIVYGNFTKSSNNEALIDLEGCKPRADNSGGSALIRKNNQQWYLVEYKAGLRSEKCLKFKASNSRHQLVCEGSHIGQGYLNTWLDVVTFTSNKIVTSTLLTVLSNEASCTPPYYEVTIRDFLAQDFNKDGKNDLIINVSEARESKNIKRSQDNLCEPRLPKPKFYQLTFLFNGQSFRPTSETAKIKKRLETWKNY